MFRVIEHRFKTKQITLKQNLGHLFPYEPRMTELNYLSPMKFFL